MKHPHLLSFIASFSKVITIVWILCWIEALLFTEVATVFGWGDASSCQYIMDNITQIGLIVCGFYFSTKCIENVAQGVESYLEGGRAPNIDEADETTPTTDYTE